MSSARPNDLWNWGIDTGKLRVAVVAERAGIHAVCTIKVDPSHASKSDPFTLRHELDCAITGELHDFALRHTPILTCIESPIGRHMGLELSASYGVIANAVYNVLLDATGQMPLMLPVPSGRWKKEMLGDGHGAEKADYYSNRARDDFPDSNIARMFDDPDVCAALWIAEYAAKIGIR